VRVVVAGGTGFIGREVVRRLLAAGHEVAVTTRDPQKDPFDGRVRLEQAFAGDAATLGKAFTGADVVVHAIQFPNHPVEDPSKGRTYLEVDGKGTEVAARTAKRVGVRRFVYVSGAGAGQGRPQPWFVAKDRAEAAVRESGLEHAILRPSWIYGPRDRSMNKFVTFVRWLPVVPVIGDGKTHVDPIHVDDVGHALAEAAVRDDARALTLDLGGPERLTMDEIIRTVATVMGRRRLLIHQPAGLMKRLVWPMRFLPTPPLSPDAIDFITTEGPPAPKPAMDYFGFPFRRLAEGLREYL